ncbi:hypothetical protein P691DRAFT_810348 [Macrolepiota fuliginosa MF-IS2]|uniref:Uncharacterized protein n=1 Tax=Macrolepiota fuliginosa MF-IS2 TaxID=1400762 RepID=A0A9P5XFE0_9AGAR|nr:hypothetical protein P691DRAFT_810348 [Macrolepiota fuliginosa MF-IS2]
MPKTQKSLQTASDTKTKQITDFFPRKSTLSSSCASRPAVVSQKNAKQLSAKENATPVTRNSHLKAKQGEPSPNAAAPSDSQEAGTGSPLPTKAVHIASPMHPSTKRLRSQSVISFQPNNVRWPNNILHEAKFEEEKMDIENSLVVHVRSETTPLPSSSFLQVPPSDTRRTKKSRFSVSPDRQLEVSSLVPSSLSEERELGPNRPEQKDIGAVKEAVDHWRQQALPPSPLTNVNSPVEPNMVPRPDLQSSTVYNADWNMAVDSVYDATPSRPSTSAATASIPTPPSTDGPDETHPSLPIEILDVNTKTEQIIRDIKARALARSRTQEPSSPLSSVASLGGSDDEDDDLDVLAGLGLGNNSKLKSSLKARTPVKPARYNLRKPAAKTELSKQGPALSLRHDTPPSPPSRRKPTANPLDALLKEERAVNGRNGMRSVDREAQLRDLASMNLDDESDDDDVNLNKPKPYVPMTSDDDGNPFIDDNQKEQVLEILQGDKLIEDEEEHLRQQGEVGVALWGPSELCTMDSYDDTLPRLDYRGSDPTLQTFAQTVAHGDRALVHLVIQAGALELANYADGGLDAVSWLVDLAISFRRDNLNLCASRILPNVLNNTTFITSVPLFERTLSTLHTLNAELSTLERLGWAINRGLRGVILGDDRCTVIERLLFHIMNAAKSRHLHRKEIPDILAALLLIGMEPSLSPEMRLQVSRVIHEVCESVGEPSNVDAEVESAICNKVLHLTQPYTLQNKLYALSFLSSGSGRVARVARSVAHAMLTDKSALLPSQYSALPPLSEIMAMLGVSSQDSLRPAGKFEIHEGTNYVEMACWTFVLAIAITDIPQYLEQEESSRHTPSPSKSPAKERDQSLVLALHEKLYKIHGRIQDTRAAHLDRSRTKAILFQTAFRILYQYQAVVQHRRKSNHNIQSYFRRK